MAHRWLIAIYIIVHRQRRYGKKGNEDYIQDALLFTELSL
jgi:hypothetical protein